MKFKISDNCDIWGTEKNGNSVIILPLSETWISRAILNQKRDLYFTATVLLEEPFLV